VTPFICTGTSEKITGAAVIFFTFFAGAKTCSVEASVTDPSIFPSQIRDPTKKRGKKIN
jgi:hypothetical protein